ncbi:MAG: chemotaxis protein CheW, partial [Myxococcales bacterium]
IVKVPPITEVPRAPRDVLGVMSLRGEILPVFDLRRRLGLPPLEGEPSRRARVLVVDAGEGHAGILVDAVAHVVRLKPSGIEPTPQGLGGGVESEYLAGIGRQKNRLYILLDVQAVLARAGGRQP